MGDLDRTIELIFRFIIEITEIICKLPHSYHKECLKYDNALDIVDDVCVLKLVEGANLLVSLEVKLLLCNVAHDAALNEVCCLRDLDGVVPRFLVENSLIHFVKILSV